MGNFLILYPYSLFIRIYFEYKKLWWMIVLYKYNNSIDNNSLNKINLTSLINGKNPNPSGLPIELPGNHHFNIIFYNI